MIRTGAVRLVAWREITERLRGRATWILTGLTMLLAIALILVSTVINQPSGPSVVGLVGPQAQALGPTLQAAAKVVHVDITILNVDSESTARAELTPSKTGQGGRLSHLFGANTATLDVAFLVEGNSATIEAYQTVSPLMFGLLRSTLNAVHRLTVLSAAGVSPATLAAAEQPVPLTTVTLQPPATDRAARAIAALAAAILLMYAVGGYGSAVAIGVAQEKTSRTAELLVAALRPPELLIGKVLGIGLVGLGQMTLTVGAAMITNAVVKSTVLPSGFETFLPAIILWFVLGFSLYAFGFAAAGAMVARQEEVQSVSIPLTIPLVLAFLLVYATIANPDSVGIKILSFLPPLAPSLMPARLALGHTAGWEFPLAVAIELLAIAGTATLAGRIYQRALVRGGPRLSWSEALRLG